MHKILTRSAAATAGVLIPLILAVCALACAAPNSGAQPSTAGQQTLSTAGLSYAHHHHCRSYSKRRWSRSVKASGEGRGSPSCKTAPKTTGPEAGWPLPPIKCP